MYRLLPRKFLFIGLLLIACLSLANEEEPDMRRDIEDVFGFIMFIACGEQILEDGSTEAFCREGTERTLIEASTHLVTDISEFPRIVTRSESDQVIFQKGEWALVASQYRDFVTSNDGQITFDLEEKFVSIIFSNWRAETELNLAYQLTIDDVHEIQSEYQIFDSDKLAQWHWDNVSDKLIKALEEGKKLKVSLVDKDEQVVHIEEYSLKGLSENLLANRSLLKKIPKSERGG